MLVAGAGLVTDEDMVAADLDPLPTAGAAIQLLRHYERNGHRLAVKVRGLQALSSGYKHSRELIGGCERASILERLDCSSGSLIERLFQMSR